MVKANTKTIQKKNASTATAKRTPTWTPAAISKAAREVETQGAEMPMTPDELISDAATRTVINTVTEAIVKQLPPEEPKAMPTDPLKSHGPDAARVNPQAPPQLIAARLVLAELIRNPPRYSNGQVGSVPMQFDRYMAQAFLERNHKNRKKNEARIRQYQRTFLNGKWAINGETVKVSVSGIVLDAQHRLEGFLRACEVNPDLTVWMDVRFDLDDDVFDTIDTGMGRTIGHSLGIRGFKNVNVLAAATNLLLRYYSGAPMTHGGRFDRPTTVEVEDAIEKYPLLIEGSDRSAVFRKSGMTPTVCAVLWALAADYDRNLAEKFFQQLVSGENLSRESPALRLRNIITTGGKRNSVQLAAIAIKAWNAFVAGKPVRTLAWREDGPAREDFPRAVTKLTKEANLLDIEPTAETTIQ